METAVEKNKEVCFYAKSAVETMMQKFDAPDLPPKGHFHYHQGVFLSGVYKTWQACGDDRYFQYMKKWVDSCIDADGNIIDYNPGQLDDIQPGILLFPLYEKTGDIRYKNVLDNGVGAFLIMCSEVWQSGETQSL